jgi:two-component system invasion response regulator UvrY
MTMVNGKNTDKKARILIADDHDLFREITKKIISNTSDLVVAAEAFNGKDILDMVDNDHFDLIIIDLVLSGRSGFEILREVKAKKPFSHVLILSAYFEELYEMSAFKNGADGYVKKVLMADELVNAVRTIMQGGKYFKLAFDNDQQNVRI